MPSRYRKTANDGDKYDYDHRKIRAALSITVKAGNAYCAQPICLHRHRWIPPGTAWDVAHDTAGNRVIGPAHQRCNRSDGAVRGNRMRARTPRATSNHPTVRRWHSPGW